MKPGSVITQQNDGNSSGASCEYYRCYRWNRNQHRFDCAATVKRKTIHAACSADARGRAPRKRTTRIFRITATTAQSSPAVNGARPEMNNFTIDGVEDNELFFNFPAINPPPDALREFNVQTNMSSGQYGRAAGANVNIVTQSGGNQFHGAAWEFLRNTQLDARNFFNPTVSIFHQNQFGGSVGGPIWRRKFGGSVGMRVFGRPWLTIWRTFPRRRN